MKILIQKVDLVEGEELQGLITRISNALGQQKAKLKKSLFLYGIFKDHIIARDFETGSFFKLDLTRNKEEVVLGKPVAVVQTFVPKKVQKSEQTQEEKYVDAPSDVSKSSLWGSIFS